MLMRDFPSEKQREFLGIIRKESRRLEELINNFLDLQRIESGKQIYQFEGLDLASTLRDCVEVFRAGSEHVFRLEIAEDLTRVRADSDRIRQVVANLIANAVKYSPGGGTITVSARSRGTCVEVAVADEGIGIPHEVLPRLFNKFFRADNAISRGIAGTGLGLALVKQIVENHGGRVWVECPAKGTIFYFTLPVAEGEGPAAAVEVARGA
jgi:signal transduction histidine kinase